MTENLSAEADVYVKGTNELVGRFPFSLSTYHRDDGSLDTDLRVQLNPLIAAQFHALNTPLVLQLKDGRSLTFVVTRSNVDVAVEALGPLTR